jgi:UTP--glucose-1-phosphate uridylyltransferase
VVEEAVRAGIRDVVFVTSRGKTLLEDHFDHNLQLETALENSGKTDLLRLVREVAEMVNVMAVRQKQQLGLGHAVLCAKGMVGNEPFAATVGDDVLTSDAGGEETGLSQLVRVARTENVSVIGVMEVPPDRINRYGIVTGTEIRPGVFSITDMVEKPPVGTVSSNLAIVGRYVLTPEIFLHLEEAQPGHGGEIQLTDAMRALCARQGMLAVKMKGIRFDAGDWLDYLTANIYFAMKDESLRAGLRERLGALLADSLTAAAPLHPQ